MNKFTVNYELEPPIKNLINHHYLALSSDGKIARTTF